MRLLHNTSRRIALLFVFFSCAATAAVSAQSFTAETAAAAERLATEHQPAWLQKLCALLSIPSVSSDPARRKDVMEAATRTAGLMSEAGLENVETSLFPTGEGHVAVYGDWLHAPAGAPTVLIYNHFDVQPAEASDGWENDHAPFPEAMHKCVKDDRVLGRGASDNKGGLVGVLAAVAAVMKSAGQGACFLRSPANTTNPPSLFFCSSSSIDVSAIQI